MSRKLLDEQLRILLPVTLIMSTPVVQTTFVPWQVKAVECSNGLRRGIQHQNASITPVD